MKTIILCGGYGRRLGHLTYQCPKPLLQVGGKPFLDYVITEYASHDLREFVLAAGFMGDKIKEAYSEWGLWRGLDIQVLVEPEPMGTLGALCYVNSKVDLGQRFLLANGDTLVRTSTSPQNFGGKAMAFRIQQKDCGIRSIRTDVLFDTAIRLPNPLKPYQTIEEGLFPLLPLKWQNLNANESLFIDIGTPEDLERARTILR